MLCRKRDSLYISAVYNQVGKAMGEEFNEEEFNEDDESGSEEYTGNVKPVPSRQKDIRRRIEDHQAERRMKEDLGLDLTD